MHGLIGKRKEREELEDKSDYIGALSIKAKPVASPARIRFMAGIKLARNIGLFGVLCFAVPSVSSMLTGFAFLVFFSWQFIPEIVTGVNFTQTSARVRGVTILGGLAFLLLLLIVLLTNLGF